MHDCDLAIDEDDDDDEDDDEDDEEEEEEEEEQIVVEEPDAGEVEGTAVYMAAFSLAAMWSSTV